MNWKKEKKTHFKRSFFRKKRFSKSHSKQGIFLYFSCEIENYVKPEIAENTFIIYFISN